MEKCGNTDDCISTSEAAELAGMDKKEAKQSANVWSSGFH